tara:strand:- start:711 stop:890 length:180 start_codon:yes stop_codon:yes gene_type:complete
MPDSVKILGGLIIGATWLILIRDQGHENRRVDFKRCLEFRMEISGDDYRTADRICTKIQ